MTYVIHSIILQLRALNHSNKSHKGGVKVYTIVKSNNGYAIFFIEVKRREYIADHLNLKQAKKWSKRLNDAYDKGYASSW